MAQRDRFGLIHTPVNVDRPVWSVLGLPIDAIDIAGAVAKIREAARARTRLSFVTPNVNILMAARRDPKLRAMIIDTDLSLADGAPVVALARRAGAPLKQRVAGSDVFDALKQGDGEPPLRVFFFGGREGAAPAALDRLNTDPTNTGLIGVGALNPGFGSIEEMSMPAILNEINEAAPDFLVVSLGFAKGQGWIHKNQDALNVPVLAHLGAVVDFTAGTIARAPVWMQKSGLEWAWRIAQEQSLWKRYASDGLDLARAVISTQRALAGRPDVEGFRVEVMTSVATAVLKPLGTVTRINRTMAADEVKAALTRIGNQPFKIDLGEFTAGDTAGLGFRHILERLADG